MKRTAARGFTLIELMIAAAVIGILLAIAVPNYQDYIRKASRSAAQSELIELAAMQEKIFLNSSAYALNVTTAYNGSSTGGRVTLAATGQSYVVDVNWLTGRVAIHE